MKKGIKAREPEPEVELWTWADHYSILVQLGKANLRCQGFGMLCNL